MAKANLAPQVALRLTGTLRERLDHATTPYAQPNVRMTYTDRVRLAIENGIALLEAGAELAKREHVSPGAAVAQLLEASKPAAAGPSRKAHG